LHCYRPFQAGILDFQILQPPGLVNLHTALSSRLSGSMPDEVMYRYVGGGILAAVGTLLVMKN
jgi:hypothetical protein